MDKRDHCVQKAKELAVSYERTLVGCAHATFAAVLDALRSEGIEVATPEVEEEIFKGLVGLSGGLGNMGSGSCGALMGASFAVSLVAGVGRKELEEKGNAYRWIPYYHVAEGVGKKFIQNLGGLTCREIWMHRFGKACNWRVPGRRQEHVETAERMQCRGPNSCTIALAAGWAAEAICDMLDNPQNLEWVIRQHEPSSAG